MTLNEAVAALGDIKVCRIPVGELKELEALNLGIEALKRERECREGIKPSEHELLPGETEE